MRAWLRWTGAALWRLPRKIPEWWRREHQDLRVILDRDGHLQYFLIRAKYQQVLVRCLLVTAGIGGFTLMGLGLTSLRLAIVKARLERANYAIYDALMGDISLRDKNGLDTTSRDAQMLDLAKNIRERQLAIRQYVDLSARLYAQENVDLMTQLEATGLTEKTIQVIERASIHGGRNTSAAGSAVPEQLLPEGLVKEIVTNHALLEVLRALPTQMPLKGFDVTSEFGIRKHPVTGIIHFHTGVDLITSSQDEQVFPVKNGKVVAAYANPQLGNLVIVQHSHGLETLYGHLKQFLVKVGDSVSPDTPIGLVGNTGLSTGPHLHFEVLIGGYPTNPIKVIRAARHVQQDKHLA